jgi:ketosteroid isomerase-like protein
MTPRETIDAFIAAINAHDVDAIVDLCSPDRRFVDAWGQVTPPDRLHGAWAGYFAFMPHYGIEVETVLWDGGTAAVFGEAWGGLQASDPSVRCWRRPAAWRVEVRDGKAALWLVYSDTKVVFDLMD